MNIQDAKTRSDWLLNGWRSNHVILPSSLSTSCCSWIINRSLSVRRVSAWNQSQTLTHCHCTIGYSIIIIIIMTLMWPLQNSTTVQQV